jgi:tetratricopeptide (TPR) repeat protein
LAVCAALAGGISIYRKHHRFAVNASEAGASRPTVRTGTNPAPEAEDFYLKGRYYWSKRTPDDLNRAVDYFTQAIVHDPNYAQAYVGLADCYNLLREYTAMPASEAYPRAFAAAKKAVELDDQSSEAHASLASEIGRARRPLGVARAGRDPAARVRRRPLAGLSG